MADLFGEPERIPGLKLADEFISRVDETALLERLAEVATSPFQFQQYTGKRQVKTYGWRYDFTDASFAEVEPIPDWLLPLRDRAAAFAGLEPGEIVHCLINRYDPGAGIGWHRDRPFFEQVVGVSLGSAAVLALRQRTADGFRRVKVPLEPRSAYLLSGEVRHEWEHGIAEHRALRWSITFRSLSAKGRRRAGR
ncbi:alpha-ketoglutarate-dependent dioxygenase AlkB [Sphingomonas ginkgonis]|uniref:Alpha-ketoglutarate-dependent dioxygenase AlkB n=1 Tax=Sphingomonas ginkgonis TaxID=2315330 RepID=A0A3R9YK58_9SPHN|nr:alpha-ketoglutarate-dependent dioxygenase AlkB [Sphingomonas ginkgonis]RST29593.1 alpha-ketoglutarate-dependent dioxygenase AlkB [Sphingomonas ginkgonis]